MLRPPHKAHRVDEPPLLFRLADRYDWNKTFVACVLSEFVCSFFLMYGGLGISCVEKIQSQTNTRSPNFEYGVAISWGLWLLLTNYIGSQLSGPHCNPAISFLLFVLGGLKWRRMLSYMAAQLVGCYLGALLVYAVYYDGINHFDGGQHLVRGDNATASIFATFPKDYLTVTGGCIDQFLGTATLAFVVLALTDERNGIPKMVQPAMIGAALWGIIATFSHNCGAALNPARDLSPRLMLLTVGYSWEVFSYNNYCWFWIPIIMPMLGAVTGGFIYKSFIGDYLPVPDNDNAMKGWTRPSLRPSVLFTATAPMPPRAQSFAHYTTNRVAQPTLTVTNIDDMNTAADNADINSHDTSSAVIKRRGASLNVLNGALA